MIIRQRRLYLKMPRVSMGACSNAIAMEKKRMFLFCCKLASLLTAAASVYRGDRKIAQRRTALRHMGNFMRI